MLDRLSACPRCSEPLTAGERFCGVCGADLTAVVGPAGAEAAPHEVWPPTVADNGLRAEPPSGPVPPAGEGDFTLAPADHR
ncbi:zinc ribbon domain-containing protein, partial [Streptomyces nanshensis]